MVKWIFDGCHLKIEGVEDFSEKIRFVKNSDAYGKVKVILSNGRQYTLRLDEYGFGEMANELNEQSRRSRSQFLQWTKNIKRIPISFQTSGGIKESEKLEGNGTEESIDDNDDKNEKLIGNPINTSPIQSQTDAYEFGSDLDEFEKVSSCSSVDLIEYTPHTLLTSDEANIDGIDQCLIGKNIQVHVKNLVEPGPGRRTRDLDLSHVKVLENQFKSNMNNLYTVLIGHLPEQCNLNELRYPSQHKVEVLGGNHTRQALLNTYFNGNVCMDIYVKLTDLQALKLGLRHNEIHNFSKHQTFEETVKLFRGLLLKLRQEDPSGQKTTATKWRQLICDLTDTPKSRVNKFQTHLHIAGLDVCVWKHVEELFLAWRNNTIKDQPGPELKQTHVFDLFRIHDNKEKASLVKQLSMGEISFAEFKAKCCKRQNKVKNNLPSMKRNHSTNQCAVEQIASKTVSGVGIKRKADTDEDTTKTPQKENENIKSLRSKVGELQQEKETLASDNKDLTRQVENLKNNLLGMKKTREEDKQKIKQLQIIIQDKDEAIDHLKLQMNMAHDAASRARQQAKDITVAENKGLQKGKNNPSTDVLTAAPKPTLLTVSLKSTPTCSLTKLHVASKNDDNEQKKQTKERTTETSRSVHVVLVEYNNKNMYFCLLDKKMLTYSRTSIGKLKKDFKLKENKITMNFKDIQEFKDDSYTIAKLKCVLDKNCILLSTANISFVERKINEYINKK